MYRSLRILLEWASYTVSIWSYIRVVRGCWSTYAPPAADFNSPHKVSTPQTKSYDCKWTPSEHQWWTAGICSFISDWTTILSPRTIWSSDWIRCNLIRILFCFLVLYLWYVYIYNRLFIILVFSGSSILGWKWLHISYWLYWRTQHKVLTSTTTDRQDDNFSGTVRCISSCSSLLPISMILWPLADSSSAHRLLTSIFRILWPDPRCLRCLWCIWGFGRSVVLFVRRIILLLLFGLLLRPLIDRICRHMEWISWTK